MNNPQLPADAFCPCLHNLKKKEEDTLEGQEASREEAVLVPHSRLLFLSAMLLRRHGTAATKTTARWEPFLIPAPADHTVPTALL